ncbi:MAG TPA: HlyD family efflux transporter periplasmic adaptor subunit [Pirellulaceae bacterium]|nr:HlyD family efflux transporter periplasmic adaptor subunit [Pirellulaceae bacterium]
MPTRNWLMLITMVAIGALAYLGWRFSRPEKLPDGFASSNGRIEAVEIDIATKTAGRIVAILVNEGDFVTAGQTLAQMDTDVLQAQLHEAEAELLQAKSAVESAKSGVTQRESEKTAAESVVAQREAELDLANKKYTRAERLVAKGAVSEEEFDTIRAVLFGAKAGVSRSQADVAAASAAVATAKSLVITSEASVGASQAKIERIQADINDSILKSPRDGRVQYRIAQPGEVLSAGGKVLNMIDLGDVYMTFFLPTSTAGLVSMGSEVRLVIDAAPQYVIPAKVSFVADVAQFTPKTVETAEERQKLMFRIKARIDAEVLKKYVRTAKTGLPGMAYVRLDDDAPWPSHLEVRLP